MQHLLQDDQHSTESASWETTLSTAAKRSTINPDTLIKAGPNAAVRHADIQGSTHAAPAASAVKARHVKFSKALVKSPTAVKALAAPADNEWTVIQSDGSDTEYASRTGSETSLVRVKSQVPQGQIADMSGQDAPQQGQFMPAGKSFTGRPVQGKAALPSKQKLTVKVPTTGGQCCCRCVRCSLCSLMLCCASYCYM